jgi:S-adenosylmethionine hydrolase
VMSTITLTTDFGTRDWFAGTMKGVIDGIAPEARVIDITHEVAPGDVPGGAFALAAAAPFFRPGTIHVAVVDPGVGSDRRAIALRTGNAIFIGPDNGVLSWAARDERVDEIRRLSNPDWCLKPTSRTFHGRDVFAPVAAQLAAGAGFSEIGEEVRDFTRLRWPAIVRGDRYLAGEIAYVDRFGNAITNVPVDDLPPETAASGGVRLRCRGITMALQDCYAAVRSGEVLAIVGSSGLLELAVNGGDFARGYGAKAGTTVEVIW